MEHGNTTRAYRTFRGGIKKKLSLQGERESFFDKFPTQENEKIINKRHV